MTWKKLCLIALGLLCCALTALLAAGAVSIYREGAALREAGDALGWIYTKERIADRLTPIAPVFLGAVIMAAAGLILGVHDERAEKPHKDAEIARDLTAARVAAPSRAMRKERKLQTALRWGGRAVFLLCLVPVLIYMIDPQHFPEDGLEAMFSSLLGHTLPWMVVGLGCLTIAETLRERSLRRETEAARTALAQGQRKVPKSAGHKEGRWVTAVRAALLLAAAVLIAVGACSGGMRDVLVKAINLCTECVGLG